MAGEAPANLVYVNEESGRSGGEEESGSGKMETVHSGPLGGE